MLTAVRDGEAAVLEPDASVVSWSVVDIVVESRRELRRVDGRRQTSNGASSYVRVTNVVDVLLTLKFN